MGPSRLGVFIQVRLASTRLAQKALLTLAGLPIIEQVMRALRPIPAAARALLTVAEDVEVLRPSANAWGFDVFAGPEQDVLQRFVLGGNIGQCGERRARVPRRFGVVDRHLRTLQVQSCSDVQRW